jgi:hypothetical protein
MSRPWRDGPRFPRAWWLPSLAGLLLAALALTALRLDLIRARYGLADALSEEQRLLAEERSLTVEVRRLRDPARLAKLARERGFVRPEQVIDLEPGGAGAVGSEAGLVALAPNDAEGPRP